MTRSSKLLFLTIGLAAAAPALRIWPGDDLQVLDSVHAQEPWAAPDTGVPYSAGPSQPLLRSGPAAPTVPTSPMRPVSWPGTPTAALAPATVAQNASQPVPGTQYPPAAAVSFPQPNYAPAMQPGSLAPAGPPLAGSNQPPWTPPPGYPVGPAPATGPVAAVPQSPADPASAEEPLNFATMDGSFILARVGSEVILASEILPVVNQIVAANAEKLTSPEDAEELRRRAVEEALKRAIDTKLVVSDARRTIPPENMPKVEASVNEQFEKNQVSKMIESQKLKSRSELDARLRQMGTSLENQRRAYFERSLAYQWSRQQVKEEETVTHEAMLTYYREHTAEFDYEGRARWEHLMVKFEAHGSKAEAYRALAELGNQILAGAPFAEVARAHSDDPSASDGGLHDWTTEGSLVSEALDKAIFQLPVGRLSQIIEDERGFHIIRVVEREDAHRKPFLEAQVEIKEKIIEERRAAQEQAYLDKLREKTPVWTVFDEPSAEDISRRAAGMSR